MNRPQNMSRRGFLRNVMGVTTAIFAGPGLILPEKKIIEFYAYEEIVWTPPLYFMARMLKGDRCLPKVRGLLADERQPQRRTA